jgi:hypothetical protein
VITVYIASPYTKGDVAQNVRRQIDAANQLAKLGYVPFWPLSSHFWHMVHEHEYEFWMRQDEEWVRRCDCLLRLPGESAGADQEVALAKSLNIPVFYSIESLIENLPADGEIVSMELPYTPQGSEVDMAGFLRRNPQQAALEFSGRWTAIGTIPNPKPRPSFWRDPLGWMKWRPSIVGYAGEFGDVITAECWNRWIEGEHPACDS